MRRVRILASIALGIALLGIFGCDKKAEPALVPKVKPPAVGKAGVLRAGVDFSVPPFAGKVGSKSAGIDVDVAAALADKFGLKVEYVDVKPSDAATALADGTVDVVFSVPLTGTDLSRVSAAGTYMTDAPALFMESPETTVTIDTIPAGKIAVQTGSESYWLLDGEGMADQLLPTETLRLAFEAVQSGEASSVAGDALVGAYMSRDFAPIVFAGQIGGGTPLAVVVAADNSTLSEAVMSALDGLAADGVLDSIRSKWVGSLSALTVEDTATP